MPEHFSKCLQTIFLFVLSSSYHLRRTKFYSPKSFSIVSDFDKILFENFPFGKYLFFINS